MYKCLCCGRTFDEPNEFETTYEAEYGVSDLFGNSHKLTIWRCPYCHAEEIDEVMEHDDDDEE